ncbi:MAG TPA: septum formation initiator family protein [Acidisoma sp.]|jgi:cell division protein FtsB|uniref:FtsB family cell division protein n=1 Tax=Acidisoma sp. TaxID=1872115 RepID=UPI002BAF8CBF|nr:septum formation initiator family protein [Acidisoma sp.]HTI02465.1 septum formation initiator family protein [Acidisoma sp.]
MSVAVMMKRKMRAAVPPLIFLALAGYFAWNATRGDRGLVAQQQDRLDLKSAQVQLAKANEEVQQWTNRIQGIGGHTLDLDALDTQARRMLNLVDPRDLVVMMGRTTVPGTLPPADPGSVQVQAPAPSDTGNPGQ